MLFQSMSSEAANNSLLNKIADITECSICAEVFKEPRCLPCAHTFCLGCLEVYGKDVKPSSKALCPICRKKFVVPTGGWKNLPRNYIVEKLLSTSSGQAVVKNSIQEDVSLTVDHLSKSVTLQIDKCQQLADRLKECTAYLPQKSQGVKEDIIRHRDELKRLVDSNAEELLRRLDHICDVTTQKLTAGQKDMETRCSELKVIQTKLNDAANDNGLSDHLEAVAKEMKPLMSEAKCESLDADVLFTAAQLQMAPGMNVVGNVEICKNMQLISK